MEDWQSFESLFEAMNKCKRGKMWKSSVAKFVTHGLEEVIKLTDELAAGTYKPLPPYIFTLTYPKERECSSINIRDRVVQRSLNDNVVYPAMVKGFVWSNVACQKGKGTVVGMDLLNKYLHRYFINNGNSNKGYVLQVDISGYYRHIAHSDAINCLSQNLPPNLIKLIEDWWKIQHPGEVGFEPGNQLTQIIGISLLSHLDHGVKERGRARYYSRYMDDFYIISNDKDYLLELRDLITKELSLIHLDINPKKTKIYPLSQGIKFLGFTFKLSTSGKVVRIIDSKNVKHERRKLYKMSAKVKNKSMKLKKFKECFISWLAHVDLGSTYKVETRIKSYVRNLMEEL